MIKTSQALLQDMLNTVTKAVASNKPARIHLLPMLRGVWVPKEPDLVTWVVMRFTPEGLKSDRFQTPVPTTLDACGNIAEAMTVAYGKLGEE